MPFRRWLPNVMLVLAVAAVFTTFPSDVSSQDTCAPVKEILSKNVPRFRILEGEAAQIAIAIFNQLPPPTDYPWASAYIAIRDDGVGLLMVGEKGTVCSASIIPAADVWKLLRAIYGASA